MDINQLRHRTRNGQVATTWIVDTHQIISPYADQRYSGVASYFGEDAGIYDDPHPGYTKSVRSGGIVMGDLFLYKTSRDYSGADFYMVSPNPGYQCTIRATGDFVRGLESVVSPSLTFPESEIDSMGANCLVSAIAKSKQAELLAGEFLADLDKTLLMIRRPLNGAVKLSSSILKRARQIRTTHATMTAARAFSKAWLEYRYGWRPLLSDCTTVVKEFNRKVEANRKRRLVYRAGMSRERFTTASLDVPTPIPDQTNWYVKGSRTAKMSVRVSAGTIVEVEPQSNSSYYAKTNGLDAGSLPATVWEIVPWSFVVDWFVNVGDWIQACTPVPGINTLGSWITKVNRLEVNSEGQLGFYAGFPSLTWGNLGTSSVVTESVTRDAHPVVSNLPSLKPGMISALNSVTAMALLCDQVLGNLRRR